jgi:hypothetical protein
VKRRLAHMQFVDRSGLEARRIHLTIIEVRSGTTLKIIFRARRSATA